MKKSWFTHTGLTTEEANELVARYKSKGVQVEKTTASTNGIALTRFREAYGRYSRQVSEVGWACSSATVQTSPR
ncbi:hypothetical protein [Enterobacter mori]